jgi:hypothetical protein
MFMWTLCAIRKFPIRFAALFILIAFICSVQPAALHGQTTSAIIGNATDSTGAAVAGATVAVRNVETGVSRTTMTDDAGDYRALSLPVGQYEVRVEKPGFKAVVRSGINLVVAQQAVVNVQLAVGEVTQSVTVLGEAQIVNTTTSPTSGLVNEQQVKDLPLNGRSFDNLITLNPSTANTTSYRSGTSTGGGQGYNFVVSGNREDFNLFMLNGVEYTGVSTADVSPGGVSGQLLGVDAVREFNVLENTYGAEYGKRPGGQVSVVTQSGTNNFHGTLFEFVRNSAFDAKNFYDQGTIPPFKRNQFGASAGGPIIKSKLFVFGNYEGFRQRLGLSSVAIVPDALARQGLLPCATFGKGAPAACTGVSPSTYVPVPGASPAMVPYFSLWPTPLATSPEVLNGGVPTGAITYTSHPLQSIREDFGNLRLDYTLSSADSLSGVYTIDDGNATDPGPEGVIQNPLTRFTSVLRGEVFSLQETHIFSSSTLNNARFGYSRAKWNLDGTSLGDTSSLSFAQGRPVGELSVGSSGLGNVGSLAIAGTFGAQQIENIVRNLFTYADDVQLTRGSHLISVGAWFQRVQSNDDAADQRNGVASFAGLQQLIQGLATQVVGTLNPVEIGWRQLEGAWYAQDSMHVRSNLTVTFGLRHEFNNGWNSPQGDASNYVFGSNGILLPTPVVGTHVFATNNAKLLFGPRIGIAYSPLQKTAIHAGFGTYYNQLDYLGSCCDASPIGSFNNKLSVGSTNNPHVFPVVLAPGLSGATPSPAGIDPNLKIPTVEEWSLKVEQGITANLLVSVGYVGEHGFHLPDTADMNAVLPTPAANGLSPATPFPTTLVRPDALLSNTRYTLSNAVSNYNALQVDVTQRLTKGLTFRGTYTFARSLDEHSSSFLANEGVAGTTTLMIPLDPRADYGPSNFDVTHQFHGNFSYNLPFGRGQMFAKNVTGWQDKLVSGWEWNGIVAVQGGFPFTPLVSFNQSNNGDSRAPDRVSLNPNFTGPVIVGTPNEWFNPAAFLLPAPGTYGNAGRDILRGPGFGELDSSLFKTTTLRENLKMQFRAEFFNLLNRANFGLPVVSTFTKAGTPSPSAGQITYTSTTSRQIQFGLKLLW